MAGDSSAAIACLNDAARTSFIGCRVVITQGIAAMTVPSKINRAVLVGTSRGPQDVIHLEGGRTINTTWGELAYQLGGIEAFDMIAEQDARGIAPGSNQLEAIFRKFSPSLILIDEWVAYWYSMSASLNRIMERCNAVQVDVKKRVRPWFFQQDNGWYVQCRYGARVLTINGKSNAVFVTKLEEVATVLEAFKAATESGELDGAVVAAMSKASKT